MTRNTTDADYDDQHPTTERGPRGSPHPTSRRKLLGTMAVIGGTALAGCAGNAPSDEGTMEPTMKPTEEPTETPEPMGNPDVPILNYALTLEHLENAFYREGLKEFSDNSLEREAVAVTVLSLLSLTAPADFAD